MIKMKRLIRTAKPRKKKKELKLTTKFVFEVVNDDETEAKLDIKAFRNWMRDEFPKWSDTILQHFLYQNNLVQTPDKPKYLLAVNIDKIIKDESSVSDERKWFDDQLEDLSEEAEKAIRKKEEELFGKSIFDLSVQNEKEK